jgi:hypothetical protein
MPLVGGVPTALTTPFSAFANRAFGLTVSGANVYFVDSRPSVARVPIAGGPETTLAAEEAGAPRAIAVDATHVYWASWGSGTGRAQVRKVPQGGGTVTVLASGFDNPVAMAVHGDQVYFVINSTFVQSVARVSTAGGVVTTLASAYATSLAVDSTGIYLGGAGEFRSDVVHYGLDGAGATALGGGAFSSRSIVLDESSVFWSSALDGIRYTPKLR